MSGFDRRAFLAWVGGRLVAAAGIGRGGVVSAAAAEHAAGGALVLRGATVFDGTGGPPPADTSIVCAGDRIVAVGRWAEPPEIAGLRVVDCTGKFVLPGLWDLHGHSADVTPTVPHSIWCTGSPESARCAGVPDAGTVAVGQLADLLVLNADPLTDIAHAQAIHSVVARGTHLGPAERQRLFEEIEHAAQEPAPADLSWSAPCCPPALGSVSSPR